MGLKSMLILAIMAILLISGCTESSQPAQNQSDKTCLGEGEEITLDDELFCCPELDIINPKNEEDEIFGICTAKCGNGVCDDTESNYNCEEDCPKPPDTCKESGGTCTQGGCTGIEFELGLPVSDCPGECCVCCKAIIPECVPAQCCHPTSCVLVQWAPDCSDIECTEECQPGTFDCGCGSCEFSYQTEQCDIVWSSSEECYTQ